MTAQIKLGAIGTFETGVFDESAAEIPAYDSMSQRLFVVNANSATLDVLDLSDPTNPNLLFSISPTEEVVPLEEPGVIGGTNSVAVSNGIVAAAVEVVDSENDDIQLPGKVFFYNTDGNFLNSVTVGSLPDMLTFTPDGTKVLVANEGEPGGDVDPEGSISIIDLSGEVVNLTDDNVSTADFATFNGREEELRAKGVRIFPGKTAAEDLEPEYIAVAPDGSTAFVTLQENNSFAVVDIESSTVVDILPLGVKDHSQGQPTLEEFEFDQLPVLGTTDGGQEILLGGLSGLFYEGVAENGNLQFVTVPDRGPNGEPTDVDNDGDNERPFALPDYQARVVRFELNETTGEIENLRETLLTQSDGITPITGRPNIEGVDEEPVDLNGNLLELDPLGADMEGIVIAPDNTFWMVDEYRPAIYHFNQDGSLIDRFVPQGTAALAGPEVQVGTFGSETLPEEYANRRRNRGFEGIALDTDENILYAFIQTPLANPDRNASDNSDIIRVLGIDPTTGNAVSEYVYLLQDPDFRDGGRVDKIGDAVYAGDEKFYVIERDSAVGETANKYIFQIDLTGATNILDRDLGDSTLEELATADALAAEGIQAVNKLKVTNLPSIGYDAGDKPEGLALLPDGRLAVLNDNDFGLLDEEIPIDGTVPLNPNPVPVVLGIIDLGENNALDGSDRDNAIEIENAPVFGLYQPDGITSFAVDGNTYYITANEGDSRDEDERIEDLNLDPDAFPNGEVLQSEEELGRLEASTIDGDLDGDGDYDQLFVYGARSFTIWDGFGNLVFDSGDDFEQIIAAEAPLIFNSQGQPDSFDNRSDNKGPEPENVVTGVVGNSTYAFIGLELAGGIMVYDVTEPANASFVQYLRSPEGDIGPEGLAFIAPEDSPNGEPLLVVANEVSGTTTVFAINEVAINEIRIDQSSDDNDEYFELAAAPGFSLDNLTYVVIGDGEGGSGVVEAVVDLSGQVVGESGFFVVAEDTFSLATADFTANLNFENSDNVTHLLVEGFNGADGDDLDPFDDGVLDVTPWSRIVDGVGLKENDEGELLYSDTVVGPDGDFVPAHVFRSSDFTGNWAIGDFSLGAQDTPGAANFEFLSTTIPAIQGEGHVSPLKDELVKTFGLVTAVDSNGFYLQDPIGDNNENTSDGIFVFTDSVPTVAVGDEVEVTGLVTEFIPGGFDTGNLSITEIVNPTVTVLSQNNELPDAVVIGGEEGLNPPTEIIQSLPLDLTVPVDLPMSEDQEVPGVEDTDAEGTVSFTIEGNVLTINGSFSNLTSDLLAEDPVELHQGRISENGDALGNLTVTDNGDGSGSFEGSFILTEEELELALAGELYVNLHTVNNPSGELRGQLSPRIEGSPNTYDPETNGIDFYETLEGMLVEVQNPLAVSGTNRFGEIFTVADNGENATGLSDRGTINISPDDFNPERIQIQLDRDILPGFEALVNVGDFLENVTGVVGYSFGNYEVLATETFGSTEAFLAPETTELTAGANQLTVASYNVLNLDSVVENPENTEDGEDDVDDDVANGRFNTIANQIVNNLQSPDIVALQEIQDNDGAEISDVVAADVTLQTLVDAIAAAGGPTYEFLEVAPENGADGGQPGGNIRVAYLYNDERVDLVEGSVERLGSEDPAFEDSRKPIETTFQFNGEEVTVVNNHFSSKGGSSPLFGAIQPPVNGGEVAREAQAQVVNDFVDNILATDPEANVVVLGDLNEFEFESPLDVLVGGEEPVLTNLTNTLPEEERYTFIFQGNSQSLDHILVSDSLVDGAELDIVHVNVEYAETPARASDHEPLVAQLTVGEEEPTFTLQILHASDLEGGVDAIEDAPNFAAIVDKLEDEFDNTVILSAGDNYIPGPFFNAAGDSSLRPTLQDFYNDLFDTDTLNNIREGNGRIDISIMNAIGFDASAVGNHEFDAGSSVFSDIIGTDIRDGDDDGVLDDVRWLGAQFPYLSANLDFSGDDNLAGLFTEEILPNTAFQSTPDDLAAAAAAPKIAPATVIESNGESIGVVGATTQLLASITSPGGVEVEGVDANDMEVLANILQPVIDEIVDDGINKIILVSHLQQIALEEELIGLLSGVDVVIAGGSDTLQADATDRLRLGDEAAQDYPLVTQNADGDPAVIVSTDGQYSYVGRLVVDFDSEGKVIVESIDENVSGAFATDEQGVADVWGSEDPFAEGTKGAQVQQLTDAVQQIVTDTDGNVFGSTAVFLEGRRVEVRTEETNLGNLTADANLAIAQEFDSTVAVSIKNGGGIRSEIGTIDGNTGEELPPTANPAAGKEAGEISQLDIENTLRFNNGLTLLTLTAEGLVEVIEHSVAESGEGNVPGRFPQVGGLEFSYNLDSDPGERVQDLAVVDPEGEVLDVVLEDGELVGDPEREIRLVTLNFLADGGDSYPFPELGTDRVDLAQDHDGPRTGVATFAADGTEQDALAEFLAANFSEEPFAVADTAPELDQRIQLVDVEPAEPVQLIFGGAEDDEFTVGVTPEFDGEEDLLFSGAGEDLIDLVGANTDSRIYSGSDNDELFAGSQDRLFGGADDDILEASAGGGGNRLYGGDGNDELIAGEGDRLFGNDGDDTLEASVGGGDNRLYGGDGDDWFFLGEGDRLVGGEGNDTFFVGTGGDNVITGGEGADAFWIADGEVPESVNTITDFELEFDVIGLGGLGIGSVQELSFENLGEDGAIGFNGQDLAVFLGVDATDLQANATFVFG